MKKLIGIIVILALIGLIIDIITALWVPGLITAAIWMGVRYYKKYKRQRNNRVKVAFVKAKEIEQKESIEYKMTKLLSMAKFNTTVTAKRQAYRTKSELDLLDLWYKYIDLRAKLHLNNVSTSREEAVLHLMCDEVLARIEFAEIEITDAVRLEFIVENVTPLLKDIIEIMEGIRPVDSISIDAYQLLNKSKGQQETLIDQLAR